MAQPGEIAVGTLQMSPTALLRKGMELDTGGEWNQALICFEEALRASRDRQDGKMVAEILRRMGHIWSKKGEWEEALVLYEESLEISEQDEDLPGQGAALCGIGTVYIEQGEWEKVRKCYGEALRVTRKTRDIKLIAQIFNVLGTDNLLPPASTAGWVENALSDSFGRVLTALPRQQAELAVRFVW